MQRFKFIAINASIFALAGLLTACGGGGGGGPGSANANTAPVVAPIKSLEAQSNFVTNGATGVKLDETFLLLFGASLNTAGLNERIELSDGSKTYPVTFAVSDGWLTVKPVAQLKSKTDYRLTIKAGVTGTDGSVLKTDFVLKFRTLISVYELKSLTPLANRGSGNDIRVAIVDVNGDGRPDLIEMDSLYRPDLFAANGYTLKLYVQDANKEFSMLKTLEVLVDQSGYSKYFNNLVVLDIDGDNKPEVLVPEFRPDDKENNGIRIFKIGVDGTLAAHAFISTNYSESLQAFDIDGDGRKDLVGSNRRAIDQHTGGFQVMLGTAVGFNLLAPITLPDAGYEFGVADFDQDGKPELIVNKTAAPNGNLRSELLVYSRNAEGGLSLTTTVTGFCPTDTDYCRDMKIVDWNGNGKPVLVFNGLKIDDKSNQNQAIGFEPKAGGGLVKRFQVETGFSTRVFAAGDMDGDGIADLLVVGPDFSTNTNYFSVVAGQADLSLEFSNIIHIRGNTPLPQQVTIGDVDGDGKQDIVFDDAHYGFLLARRKEE